MSELLTEIQKLLRTKANDPVVESVKKFIPGSQKIYGVKMPDVNKLAKQFKGGSFELVEELWKSGAFEERMLAAKMLRHICKKDPQRTLMLIEKFSGEISDWAICDTLGMQSAKPITKNFREQIFALAKKLNRSKNFWQRRLSLVLVEEYTKDESTHAAILKLVKPLENDEEYYVKKAVMWIKRNMKKER